ncbi:zinc finger, CCHC-type containing protein [Tanacetum coccineum]
MQTVAGDGVAGIKRRRRDLSSDGVRNFATASGRGRLNEDLESSTRRRRQDYKATYTAYGIVKLPVKSSQPSHQVFGFVAWGIVSLFSSTTMGDANPIRTLRDYSKHSHEGYMNTIELPVGNNVVPLRSDTIRLVQNGCSFHGLWSEDPNQHLKDFLKLVDSLDLDGENRERTRLRLFQFSFRDQASNWLERLPTGSITTWEDLTARFLAQFFPPGRTAKLRNDILMFQQHQGESLPEACTRFKDLLQKVPHHGIDRWLQIQIFYDHASFHLKYEIDRAAGKKIRNKNPDESWEIIENLALYDHEGWNDAKEFVKPIKAISIPQPTSKMPYRRLLELEDQINFLLKGSQPTP